MADQEVIEPAIIDSYMESKSLVPTEQEEINYLRARYNGIQSDYKLAKLERAEALKIDNQQVLTMNRAKFEANYTERKYVVSRLRELGCEVDDKFIIKEEE